MFASTIETPGENKLLLTEPRPMILGGCKTLKRDDNRYLRYNCPRDTDFFNLAFVTSSTALAAAIKPKLAVTLTTEP